VLDTESVNEFEAMYSTLMDTLEQLKRLRPPLESEGPQAVALWFRDFHSILQTLPPYDDSGPLVEFAEETAAAVATVGGGRPDAVQRETSAAEENGMMPSSSGFWAMLTSEKAAKGGYYSWKRLQSDASTDYAPAITGTDNAKEVNETENISVHATTGTVVWLTYDVVNQERVFVYGDTGGIDDGTADYQVPVWNNTTKLWVAGWVKAH